MKLLISKSGHVYASGPRPVRKINSADVIRRITERSQEWTACFSI